MVTLHGMLHVLLSATNFIAQRRQVALPWWRGPQIQRSRCQRVAGLQSAKTLEPV